MDKRTAIMAVLALALLLPGCAKKPADAAAALPNQGLSLIANMDTLASSKGYAGAMSASSELTETVARMGEGDYAAPKGVYRLSFQKDMIAELLGGEGFELPETLNAWVESRAYISISSQITARSGASTLAAASCVSYSESFLCPELTAPTLYLYQYDGAYSAMVSFLPGQDGAAYGTALFVPGDDALMAAGSAGEIAAWINEAIGFAQVGVETVDWQA